MHWLPALSYFFGGIFFINAIPHLVSGLRGQSFQSPFAKPPGRGLSSSTVNVLWGWLNLVIAYLFIFRVGHFDFCSVADIAPAAIGGLLISLHAAHHFGQFHGGANPLDP